MQNIVEYKNPLDVNVIEWAMQHPNCDAIIYKDECTNQRMKILAYATNVKGNIEIQNLAKTYGMETSFFRGIDSSVINQIGVIGQ